MPINAGLINALSRPVRSVQDYQDDYTRQDIQQQGLQRNALMMQEAQAAMTDRADVRAQAAAQRNALNSVYGSMPAGHSPADLEAALIRNPLTAGRGYDIQKDRVANEKTAADTAKLNQARGIEGDQQARLLLQAAQNPSQAAEMAKGAVMRGLWTQERAMSVLDGMPIDLAQWDTWRNRQLAPAQAPKDLLPRQGVNNSGGFDSFYSQDPLTGAVTVNSKTARQQTPGEVARLGEDRRQFGITSGLAADKFKYEKDKDAKELAGGGKATEGERNAAGYASRMVEATKLLDLHEKDGRATYRTDIAGGLPMVGNAARTAVMTPEQQQYRQAQEDWVRAKLRKESGAAIGVDEMDREIASYFPQPGEAKPVIDQKRRARAVAVEAMNKASGRAGYESTVPATAEPLSAAEQSELEQLRAKLGRK